MNFTRFKCLSGLCLGLTLSSWIVGTAAQAATISNLYNTGVNNVGNALAAGGLPDLHYVITASPSGPQVARTVTDTTFPFPPWIVNNYTPLAGSRWIGPDGNGNGQGPPGNYAYRTTFTIPPTANLSTVNVSGLWSTDDGSINIFINGNPTGAVASGFNALWPFSVTSGFVYGANTLVFALNNAGSVTGLRVDKIVGTYQVIPEPVSACLAAGALCSVLVLRRRRSAAQR